MLLTQPSPFKCTTIKIPCFKVKRSKLISKLYACYSAAPIPSCHCHRCNLSLSYTFIFILLIPEGRAGEAWETSNSLMLSSPRRRLRPSVSLVLVIGSYNGSGGRSPTQTSVRCKVIPCEKCDGPSGSGTGFFQSTSAFPCQYHFTIALHTSSPTCCWYQKDF